MSEGVLRGRALEVVNEHGRIGARLNVESNGEVVFRLLDQEGSLTLKNKDRRQRMFTP